MPMKGNGLGFTWLLVGVCKSTEHECSKSFITLHVDFLFQINTETLPTGPPLPIVVITIAIRHEPYIIADTNGNPTAWVSVQINAAVYINLLSRHDQCIIYLEHSTAAGSLQSMEPYLPSLAQCCLFFWYDYMCADASL